MYDKFTVKLKNGSILVTTSFNRLLQDDVIDVILHERTIDDGKTWFEPMA